MKEPDTFQNRSDKEIFFEALDKITPAERAAFLDGACGRDPARRARVEALLANFQEGTFMKKPAVEGGRPTTLAVPISEAAGTVIGHYKLLQQIGEGGCGIVYMAEQEKPVRRRVALKVIKLGMDTKEVIARFEAERQALAMMDHPNIAKVLDAGATDTGRPYFVMELVRGIKITDYCDQNNLPARERLDLFVQICRAIQHAHQKGIIHRDIKPSNILVTMNDGVPLPKVIDFGIAKATHGKLTDQTLFTAFEQFIGTPAYMSPEQAEMSAMDIDTRSDIYSLGVLLYELLTGQTPFDAKKLLQSGLDEIRRTIREQEPARPSTCLSTMQGADLTTIAKQRKIEPPGLIHLVRGDLDWIVMKALEKDRTRRYETASGLAADIQRHLNNEPVVARPPSQVYRFQKLVRRNKLAVFSVAAVAVALVMGIAVSAWQAVRALRAEREQRVLRQQAQTQQAKAETETVKSQQAAKFLEDMLLGVDPAIAKGRDTTLLREILDKAAERTQTEIPNQPSVQAGLLTTIGAVYVRIGLYSNAEAADRLVLKLRRKPGGGDDAQIAAAMNSLAHVLSLRSKNNDEAEKLYQDALAISKKEYGEESEQVAVSLSGLADLLGNAGQISKAEALCRQVLAMRIKLSGEENAEVASARHDLAFYLRTEGREGDKKKLDEAEKLARQELALRKKLSKGDDTIAVAGSLSYLGDVLLDENQDAEAENMYRQALAIQHKLLGDDNPATVTTFSHLGNLLARHKTSWDEAESLLREAVAKRRQIYGNEHPYLASTMSDLGSLLFSEERFPEAEFWQRQAYDIIHGKPNAAVRGEHFYAMCLAKTLLAEKKFPDAFPLTLELAEKGDVTCQLRVAQMYQTGDGVVQNARLAGEWFIKAAEKSTDAMQLNNSAWDFAISPDPAFRNAPAAIAMAERAVSLTQRKNDEDLDTLAAAYADAGQFEKAIAEQNEAISLTHNARNKTNYESRLKLYQANTPYHLPFKTSAALPGFVAGVVLAEDTGQPMAKALVRVSSPAIDMRSVRDHRKGVYDAWTDANGRFKVQVPHNEKLSLNAFAPGYEEAAGLWMSGNWTFNNVPFPTNQTQEFTIKLRPALYVAGVVVDEYGQPFAGAHTEATLCDESSLAYVAFGETDANGRFEIFDFPLNRSLFNGNTNARGQLTFEHSTMLKSIIENIYTLSAIERTNLRVTIRRGHEVRGVLTSADGQPMANTEVEAVPSDGTADRKTGTTDAKGQYVIRGLPDGEVTVRAHSLPTREKARTTVQFAVTDAKVNLHLEPLVYKNPPKPASLFGMKLADVTPELQSAYDLYRPTGVLVLDPGTNSGRLGIGWLKEGQRLWMVGNREIKNLREMAAEMLRVNAIDPPGDPNEGCRGSINTVHDFASGTDTERLKLTADDVAELKKLAATLGAMGDKVLDTVDFTGASLMDAIQSLAREARMNVKFDPAFLDKKAAGGTSLSSLKLNEKWQKVTPLQALQALVNNYGLQMIKTPDEPILRISALGTNAVGPQRTIVNLSENTPANGAANNEEENIAFDASPLPDAIRFLAIKAKLNIQLDPLLANRQDQVDTKWKNITARQAFLAMLDNWGLQMTQIPGNPIFRIEANQTPKAGRPPEILVNLLENAPANGTAAENEVMTDIKFDNIPLTDAIQLLAVKAGKNIVFDPAAFNQIRSITVNQKWKNLTPRQALQALLLKYGLGLTGRPGSVIWRVIAMHMSGGIRG